MFEGLFEPIFFAGRHVLCVAFSFTANSGPGRNPCPLFLQAGGGGGFYHGHYGGRHVLQGQDRTSADAVLQFTPIVLFCNLTPKGRTPGLLPESVQSWCPVLVAELGAIRQQPKRGAGKTLGISGSV